MGWKPSFPGEKPTLGWAVLDWMSEMLVVPDGASAGEPFIATTEQAKFILMFYEIDPLFVGSPIEGRALRNARIIRRAVLSRPKGWGKSPLLAALCLTEGLAPVVFDGWDANGQPVARPWSTLGFKPKVQVLAASEDQTVNTWDPLLDMARHSPIYDEYDIEPMETFINIPRGVIEPATSSGVSREGFRPVFTVMDQTETWTPSNGGVKLAATVRRNLAKVGGSSIESPNAFIPGENSVAESSFAAVQAQNEGRLRFDRGMLFDHREAPPETDPTDLESLKAGLAVVYGDSADVNGGWVSLDRIVAEYYDPDTSPQMARLYYLNQITHATDSWITQPDWGAVAKPGAKVAAGTQIVLGFDGSRKRSNKVTDATALVGCTVKDGLLFPIQVWEQPDNDPDWQVPLPEVDARVREAFDEYDVVGFFADPRLWETSVVNWEAEYGQRLKAKMSVNHPIQWWFTPSKIVKATAEFEQAVLDKRISHNGSSVLTRHVLNARRRVSNQGMQIAKPHPDSDRKIDAAVAAILAWQARLAAVGVLGRTKERSGRVW